MQKNKKAVFAGDLAPEGRIYRCNKCGNLNALLEKDIAPKCELCESIGREQYWVPTAKKIISVSKDINKEFERRMTWQDRLSDVITDFCGNMGFVYLHVVWFGFWVFANLDLIPGVPAFDPFPYGLLTMVVSLEAILLATFILISQNRSNERAELRSEYDYQVDLKSEKHLAEILELLKMKKKK